MKRWVRRFALMALAVVVASAVWAPTAGLGSAPMQISAAAGGQPFDLWSVVQEGGRAAFIGLLFYLWLDQRAEVRKERAEKMVIIKEKEVLHERVLNALNGTAGTMDDLVKLLSGGASGNRQ